MEGYQKVLGVEGAWGFREQGKGKRRGGRVERKSPGMDWVSAGPFHCRVCWKRGCLEWKWGCGVRSVEPCAEQWTRQC